MKQYSFDFKTEVRKEFGGSLLAGKRKSARPLATKRPMHFVFKSARARGSLSFVNHRRAVENTIARVSKQFHVKLYSFAVNFDHLHLVVQLPNREFYLQWVRALTSAIVRVLAAKTRTKIQQFFTLRPYSRIIEWGRQFKIVLEYQLKNQREIFGIFRTKPLRKRRLDTD